MKLNEFLNKWKYVLFIGIFVATMGIAQVGQTFPATITIEGDHVWVCFPNGIICAKVYKNEFCEIKRDRGVIVCKDTLVDY